MRTSDQPLRQVGELLAGCGIEGWRVYGWLAFELSYLPPGLPEVPDGVTLGHLVVPTREVRLRAGSALLRCQPLARPCRAARPSRAAPGAGELAGW